MTQPVHNDLQSLRYKTRYIRHPMRIELTCNGLAYLFEGISTHNFIPNFDSFIKV